MNKKVKKGLLVAIGVMVVLIICVFVLNAVVEHKLESQIAEAPENIKIKYKSLKINTLKGNLELEHPQIVIYGKTTDSVNAQIELEHFSVTDFGYWNYLVNDEITLGNIVLRQPKMKYYHNDLVKSKSYNDAFKNSLNKLIKVHSFQIHKGEVEIRTVSNDSLMLDSKKIDLRIEGLQISQSNPKQPITYKDFAMSSQHVFYQVSDYENLFLEHIDVHPNFSKFKGLRVQTKYSKSKLSSMIPVERDHYNLRVDSIEIQKQDFGIAQDSLFYFKSERMDVYQPNFKIFRDKLVEDDMSYKPLYSKMLRDLKFDMTLSTVLLNNTSITYTEKVNEETTGGKLLFSKLNAQIKNLSNTYKPDEAVTSVNVKAIFMDNSPINVQWDFDINDTSDAFVFKAEMGKLNADSMNQFMEPNLNVRLEGEINKTYFTLNANEEKGHIDLKLNYDDFDVIILKENGEEKNKFLSSIVNIFVSKDSKDKAEDFRHGSKSDIERAKNKSVFNYLWLNLKGGLMNAMTGDGKEKDKN
ncbi:hypothetical protein ACFFU9_15700 [Mariniflexile ostreae]|uniref:DUF748 domain-containing protein n=1 Tax=Mariniflexile ostreae TaxID=1520892 RepID=A0ABV5FFR4_9FLAO